MAEIVLVNPPLSLEERYGKFARGGTQTPPIGLAQVAAVTRDHGWDTAILDCAAEGLGYADAEARIAHSGATVVGITAVTIAIANAAKLARVLREAHPEWRIILGGPHVTAAPEETLRRFPEFDIAVVGEGEVTVRELLDALKSGAPLDAVAGLAFRKPDGSVALTPPRPLIEDLDSLPIPAWDLLPPLATSYETPMFYLGKTPSSSLVTSRGCCGRCTFCDRSLFGNACRMHSAQRVLECMRLLHEQYGINDVIIHDDAFVINRRRVNEFCAMLRDSGLDMTWGCNARVNLVSPELLHTMRAAGCWHIAYGLESGSQRVLDTIRKGTTLEQAANAVTWAHEAGLRTRGFFMIGHPTETVDSIRETIAFAKALPIDDFQITFFTPFPGSEVYENIREYGSFNDDWTAMNMWEPLFIAKDLTREQLIYWQRRAFREFYFRPRVVARYLKIVKNPRHVMKLARGAFALVEGMVKGG